MSVVYVNGQPTYHMRWDGPTMFASVSFSLENVATVGMSEAELDSLAQTVADAVNATADYPMTVMIKTYMAAYGTDSWTYTPAAP